LGYLAVILMVGLLLYSIIRYASDKKSVQEVRGYYLLVDKKKEDHSGKCYGVFQQDQKQIECELPFSLYLHLQVPQRGYLYAKDKKVKSFKTKE